MRSMGLPSESVWLHSVSSLPSLHLGPVLIVLLAAVVREKLREAGGTLRPSASYSSTSARLRALL